MLGFVNYENSKNVRIPDIDTDIFYAVIHWQFVLAMHRCKIYQHKGSDVTTLCTVLLGCVPM